MSRDGSGGRPDRDGRRGQVADPGGDDGWEEWTLPHDPRAEQVTLGSMMMSPDAIADVTVAAGLVSESFHRPAHQLIFEAIIWCASRPGENGAPPPSDAIAVANRLRQAKQLSLMGGAPYLHTCLAAVPAAANAGWYARIVKEHALARDMVVFGGQLVQAGRAADMDIADRVEHGYRILDRAAGLTSPPQARPIAELLPAALNRIEDGPPEDGIRTGWTALDQLLGGLHPGQFIVIAARTSAGKSVALHHTAAEAAIGQDVGTLLATAEMSRLECITRILAARARVPYERLRDGTVDDGDWEALAGPAADLGNAPLLINDDGLLRVRDIRADLRAQRRRKDTPVSLVAIDHLHLMSADGRRPDNRQAELAGISRDLKRLAKDDDVCVVAAAQLNRGPELRANHEPLLADLRDSGTVEQDADVVILLFRPDMYDPADRPGEVDLIVAKHRGGRTGRVTLTFDGAFTAMYDPAWDPTGIVDQLAGGPAAEPVDQPRRARDRQPPF